MLHVLVQTRTQSLLLIREGIDGKDLASSRCIKGRTERKCEATGRKPKFSCTIWKFLASLKITKFFFIFGFLYSFWLFSRIFCKYRPLYLRFVAVFRIFMADGTWDTLNLSFNELNLDGKLKWELKVWLIAVITNSTQHVFRLFENSLFRFTYLRNLSQDSKTKMINQTMCWWYESTAIKLLMNFPQLI